MTDATSGLRERLAWTGSTTGLAWTTQGSPIESSSIFFTLLDEDLLPLTEDTLVAETVLSTDTPELDLIWDGEVFHIMWRDGGGDRPGPIRHQILDADGSLIGTPQPLSEGGGVTTMPIAARNNEEILVVWVDERSESRDLYGRILPLDGTGRAEVPLRAGSGEQWLPAVAWGGSSFLVVYLEQSSMDGIYAFTVTTDEISEPWPILGEGEPASQPQLVSLPDGFALIFQTVEGVESTLNLLSLDLDGMPSAAPVILDAEARNFSVVPHGTNLILLAVRTDFVTAELILSTFGSDGERIGEPFLVSCADSISSPNLALAEGRLLLTWTESDPDPLVSSRIYVTARDLE